MNSNNLGSKILGIILATFLTSSAITKTSMLINNVFPNPKYNYTFPISQSVGIIASIATVFFLLAYIFEKNLFSKKIEKFSELRFEKRSHGLTYILLCFTLWLIFGGSLSQGVQAFEIRFILNKAVEFGTINQISILFNQLILIIPFILVPITYMVLVNQDDYKKVLGLKKEGLVKNFFIGVGVGFLILFAVGIVNLILIQLFGLSQENMALSQIARLGPFFALFISLTAGISEEVFFRGFLQDKLGIIIASFLFAITHAAYGIVIQITGPFVFGLIVGFAYKKTETIITPIIAHITLNLVVLFSTIYSLTP